MEIKMTKKQAVFFHLKTHGHITAWEAITLYKSTRLADTIYKLKNEGHEIYTLMVEANNVRFARYFLKV